MRVLDDGRELMASFDDIDNFFRKNKILGRTIIDIKGAAYDYMIGNLEDLDDIWNSQCSCGIETDSQVCIIFEDGDNMEVEFIGDGPKILGFNTAKFENYPKEDGSCYTLHTMFEKALGKKIVDIRFEKTEFHMSFSAYNGIDMSAEDDGIDHIEFVLSDDTVLRAGGWLDFYSFEHKNLNGEDIYVPFRNLLIELNRKTVDRIFADDGPEYYNSKAAEK